MATATKLLTLGEWYEWAYSHKCDGLTGLEQAMRQSVKEKVCIRCLQPHSIVLQVGRHLIKSTDYYMCTKCLKHYEMKGGSR